MGHDGLILHGPQQNQEHTLTTRPQMHTEHQRQVRGQAVPGKLFLDGL